VRWPRFTIRGLVLAVGFAAALLAIPVCLERDQTSPWFGLVLVVACVGVMALARVAEEIRRDRSLGSQRSPARMAALILGSIALAATIVLAADLSFLVVHQFARELRPRYGHYPAPVINDEGFVAGIVMAVLTASCLRKTFCLTAGEANSDRRRRWVRLWPIGVVAILAAAMGVDLMRDRFAEGRRMAHYHAAREAEAIDRESSALHGWLRREYERRMWRPWLPLHPESSPPRPRVKEPDDDR
jgi:hypothetical protein